MAGDIRSQHREVIRNDEVVLRICPWPVRHRARLAAEKAIVISDIGRNAIETVLADPRVYAAIPPDMPTVRGGDDPNGVVRNASQSFGGAECHVIVNEGERTDELERARFARPEPEAHSEPETGPSRGL